MAERLPSEPPFGSKGKMADLEEASAASGLDADGGSGVEARVAGTDLLEAWAKGRSGVSISVPAIIAAGIGR